MNWHPIIALCCFTFLMAAIGNAGAPQTAKISCESTSQRNLLLQHPGSFDLGGLSCDTISNINKPGDNDTASIYLWQLPSSGYLSGNSTLADSIYSYSTSATAEAFSAPAAGMRVTNAFVFFGYTSINGADSAKLITAYVYDNTGSSFQGANFAPGNAMDSATVSLSSIASSVRNHQPVNFNFTSQPILTDTGFFVVIALPSTRGDTLVVWTNKHSIPPGGSWMDIKGLGWTSISAITGGSLSVDEYIVAVVCGCPNINVSVGAISNSSAMAHVSGGTAPYTYSWNTTPVQHGDTATGLMMGLVYRVTVTDANGCSGAGLVNMDAVPDLGDPLLNFSLSPNPAKEILNVSMHLSARSDLTLCITDLMGQKVYSELIHAVMALDKDINIHFLTAGVYLLSVKTENGMSMQRFIVR